MIFISAFYFQIRGLGYFLILCSSKIVWQKVWHWVQRLMRENVRQMVWEIVWEIVWETVPSQPICRTFCRTIAILFPHYFPLNSRTISRTIPILFPHYTFPRGAVWIWNIIYLANKFHLAWYYYNIEINSASNNNLN